MKRIFHQCIGDFKSFYHNSLAITKLSAKGTNLTFLYIIGTKIAALISINESRRE